MYIVFKLQVIKMIKLSIQIKQIYNIPYVYSVPFLYEKILSLGYIGIEPY